MNHTLVSPSQSAWLRFRILSQSTHDAPQQMAAPVDDFRLDVIVDLASIWHSNL